MRRVEELANYALNLKLDDIPSDVIEEAKRIVIDTLGCIVGSQKTEIGPVVIEGSAGFGSEGASSIVGRHERVSAFCASYCNGRLGNAMDFDDTHASGIHLATGVMSGALAYAEEKNSIGADLLMSVIVGYELGGRFARALGPYFSRQEMGPIVSNDGDGVDRSFPRVWALAAPLAVGAAAAAGRMLALSEGNFVQALATTIYNAPLLQGSAWNEALLDLPNMKYCDAGMCSLVGVQSALMAKAGTTSFPALIEGDASIVRLFGNRRDDGLNYLTSELGAEWMIRNSTFKPWPSCRLTHQPMTALERILSQNKIDPKAIDRIEIETNKVGCIGRFTQREAKSFVAKQFSFPHMIALQVMRVPPGTAWMEAHWPSDAVYRDLVAKIEMVLHPRGERFDEFMVDNEFRQIPGGARVVCGDTEYYEEAEFADGDPWDRSTYFSDEDIDKKFKTLVSRGDVSEILESLRDLENLNSIGNVMSAIADKAGLD